MTIMIMICCEIWIILNKNNILKTTETKSKKKNICWHENSAKNIVILHLPCWSKPYVKHPYGIIIKANNISSTFLFHPLLHSITLLSVDNTC